MIHENVGRFGAIRALVIVGLLGVGLAASIAVPALAGNSGTWATTGSLNTARSAHTATLLANGQVLVAGGCCVASGNPLASAELYNPSTGRWTATGSMTTARYSHDATLLSSGEVLVTGGIIGQGTYYPILTSSVELYDPSTGKWTATGSMSTTRFRAGATLLQNGQLLVAGGLNETLSGIASAELYDPSKGAWNTTSSMNRSRATPATLLQNGQVLMAGGNGNTAELYNPSTARWTLTATMYFGAYGSAALLTNGDVLSYGNHLPSYASEFYDPFTNTWKRTYGQSTGNISAGPLALLGSGKLLLAGGTPKYGRVTSAALLYDPSTNYWTFTGGLSTARTGHTLTRLLNGQVLATGGSSLNGYTVTAELYTP